MSFNQKLFQLGNEVVRIRQELDKNFPEPMYGICNFDEKNILKYTLSDILNLINEVRMALEFPDRNKRYFDIKVLADTNEIIIIEDYLKVLNVNFEIKQG